MPGPNPLLIVFYISMMVIASAGANADDKLDAPDFNRTRVEITIEDRKIKGDKNVFRVYQGEHIELIIVSDETVSLHFHGYDIEFKVNPEEPAIVPFTAYATGRFPVSSHGWGDQHEHGHQTLFYLEVYPQ